MALVALWPTCLSFRMDAFSSQQQQLTQEGKWLAAHATHMCVPGNSLSKLAGRMVG